MFLLFLSNNNGSVHAFTTTPTFGIQSTTSRLALQTPRGEINTDNDSFRFQTPQWIPRFFLAGSLALSTVLQTLPPMEAMAADSRVVGELEGSGLFFKDTLLVECFDDPKVCVCV